MNRQEILKIINPYGIYKNLERKTDNELNDLLIKCQTDLFEFNHNDYIGKHKLNTRVKTRSSNIREPDEYKTEQMIIPYETYDYDDSDDVNEGLQQSIAESNAILEAEKYDENEFNQYNDDSNFFDNEPEDEIVDEPSLDLNIKTDILSEKYDMEKLSNRPSEITNEFLDDFCELCENKNFKQAKQIIDSLSPGSCLWLYRFPCGTTTLKTMIKSESEDIHTYFMKTEELK